MLEFWNAPYPFNDFLVFVAERKKKKYIKVTKNKLQEIGLNNFNQRRYGNYTSFSASSIPTNFLQDENTTVLSGVARYKDTFIFGQHDINSSNDYRDIGDCTGIFTSIYSSNEQIVISQDFFGCGILFYAVLDGSLVVSNRYHLLLLFLSWIGFKGEINFRKVVASLYSNTTFLAQNISKEMDISGTYQLPLDKEIFIDKLGWKIIDKKSVRQSFEGCTESERIDLIECAKNEIVENVQVILKSNRFTKYITDLSGGVDSRVVLASVLNIPDAKSKFEIYTKDVPDSDDLRISLGISKYFGLNYFEEEGRSQHPLTLDENLDIWRSYFMGTYYRMGTSAWSPKGDNIEQIRLSGGCGELYRTFWYKIYGGKVNNAQGIEDLVEKLVNTFSRLASPNINYKNMLIEVMSAELKNAHGESPISKFDNQYLYFRNRYHFGMRAFEYFHDSPIWFPLMSKNLFKVSQSLSCEEKNDNTLMLYLTKNLNESLVKMDYDSMILEKNKYLHSIGITPNQKIVLNSDKGDWEELQVRNKEKLLKNQIKMDSSFYNEWKNSDKIIVYRMFNAFYKLREINSDLNSLLDPIMLNNILLNLNNTSFRNSIYAKLSSIEDQIDIFI